MAYTILQGSNILMFVFINIKNIYCTNKYHNEYYNEKWNILLYIGYIIL